MIEHAKDAADDNAGAAIAILILIGTGIACTFGGIGYLMKMGIDRIRDISEHYKTATRIYLNEETQTISHISFPKCLSNKNIPFNLDLNPKSN